MPDLERKYYKKEIFIKENLILESPLQFALFTYSKPKRNFCKQSKSKVQGQDLILKVQTHKEPPGSLRELFFLLSC